jgi:dTDP-4-amino-4,6-dideoxygalactose transaminase
MIPMVNLKREYRKLKAQIDQALLEVLEETRFILGPNVTALEKEVAALHNAPDAVAVANGTDALRLALQACGIGRGDEVLTTAFTFIATTEAIMDVGAVPVFVDIQEESFNIDPARIEACITGRTKAIVPVHLFGYPAQMDTIMSIAKQYNLKVIEDCAQAFGARHQDRATGSFGHCGCYSFYPSKNLGCYGDGGMVVTRHADTAAKLRMLRNHGSKAPYEHSAVGCNSRLDEMQAAIIRVKLHHIDTMNARRRRNAQLYRDHLSSDRIILPQDSPSGRHVYNQFTLRCERRDAIMASLKEHQIAAALFYPIPLHRQEIFSGTPIAERSLPITEKAAGEVISLPMFPDLMEAEIITISQVVNEAVA